MDASPPSIVKNKDVVKRKNTFPVLKPHISAPDMNLKAKESRKSCPKSINLGLRRLTSKDVASVDELKLDEKKKLNPVEKKVFKTKTNQNSTKGEKIKMIQDINDTKVLKKEGEIGHKKEDVKEGEIEDVEEEGEDENKGVEEKKDEDAKEDEEEEEEKEEVEGVKEEEEEALESRSVKVPSQNNEHVNTFEVTKVFQNEMKAKTSSWVPADDSFILDPEDFPSFSSEPENINLESSHKEREKQGCSFNDDNNVVAMTNKALKSLILPKYASVFPYPFNAVQCTVATSIFNNNAYNIIVSAPTGAGKTTIFELAAVKELQNFSQSTRGKVVYLVPLRALATEMELSFKKKFPNEPTYVLTRDSNYKTLRQDMASAFFIFATPEKLESVMRIRGDNQAFLSQISLLLLDEIHGLGEKRGATLEAIVARLQSTQCSMKIQEKHCPLSRLQIIALSATLQNIGDVGEWLGPGTKIHTFGEEYRPVKLETYVLGYRASHMHQSCWQFQRSLSNFIFDVVCKYGEGMPTMVFCSTRKGTTETAASLIQSAEDKSGSFTNDKEQVHHFPSLWSETRKECGSKYFFVNNRKQEKALKDAARQIVNEPSLRVAIQNGIAFHHAGLTSKNRSIVEGLFRHRLINVLCTTSTLAMGVNFPAHCVIIKGTQQWRGEEGYCEYEASSLLQMTGRAGRPQYDETGIAVIMTHEDRKRYFEDLAHGQKPVESSMDIARMTEFLNAEISLGSISSIEEAIEWVQSTFFYVRAQKNPEYYGISYDNESDSVNASINERTLRCIKNLVEAGMIAYRGGDDTALISLDGGRLMSRYYLAFQTVEAFSKVTDDATLYDILCLCSNAIEFEKEYSLRREEIRPLRNIQGRFSLPKKGKMKLSMKVSQLLQYSLSHEKADIHPKLRLQITGIIDIAKRVLKALVAYLTSKSICSPAAPIAKFLLRSLSCRMWENSNLILQQLSGVGPKIASKLAKADITSFEILEKTNEQELDRIVNRKIGGGFGRKLICQSKSIPRCAMEIQRGVTCIKVITTIFQQENIHKLNYGYIICIIKGIQSLKGDIERKLVLWKRINSLESQQFSVPVKAGKPTTLKISIMNSELIGLDQSQIIHVHGGIREEKMEGKKVATITAESASSKKMKKALKPSSQVMKKKENNVQQKMSFEPVKKMVTKQPSKKKSSRRMRIQATLDRYAHKETQRITRNDMQKESSPKVSSSKAKATSANSTTNESQSLSRKNGFSLLHQKRRLRKQTASGKGFANEGFQPQLKRTHFDYRTALSQRNIPPSQFVPLQQFRQNNGMQYQQNHQPFLNQYQQERFVQQSQPGMNIFERNVPFGFSNQVHYNDGNNISQTQENVKMNHQGVESLEKYGKHLEEYQFSLNEQNQHQSFQVLQQQCSGENLLDNQFHNQPNQWNGQFHNQLNLPFGGANLSHYGKNSFCTIQNDQYCAPHGQFYHREMEFRPSNCAVQQQQVFQSQLQPSPQYYQNDFENQSNINDYYKHRSHPTIDADNTWM
eukprot:g5082.t1